MEECLPEAIHEFELNLELYRTENCGQEKEPIELFYYPNHNLAKFEQVCQKIALNAVEMDATLEDVDGGTSRKVLKTEQRVRVFNNNKQKAAQKTRQAVAIEYSKLYGCIPKWQSKRNRQNARCRLQQKRANGSFGYVMRPNKRCNMGRRNKTTGQFVFSSKYRWVSVTEL